jgi:hypothetical protein
MYEYIVMYTDAAYGAAGVLFRDETHFIAGYQPKLGLINGIGGKKEAGDKNAKATALREMLEELFGYNDPRIIDALVTIQEEKVIDYGSYIVYVYSLYHLSSMLYIISTFRLQSPYYEHHPLTIHDLIYKRRLLEAQAHPHPQELTKGCSQQELTKLHLLPLTRREGLSLDLIKDITAL